ncbi:MAG: hypothetical protein JWQ97_1961 [Phenylobacterium sp.]|nr:hypothetical protein [Phenylobacterium sp.]
MRLLLARLLRDSRGAALAEFAMVAPLMLLLFFGSVEVVQAVEAQRRLAHVASAIADVAAQDRTIDDGELADIFAAAPALMQPFPAGSLGERLISFRADSSGAVSVDWRADGAAYAGDEPAALPAGYLPAGESVIVADVSYAYQPLLTLVFADPIQFQKRAYLRPRLSDHVVKK